MNAPAKRFSLTRILTATPPPPAEVPATPPPPPAPAEPPAPSAPTVEASPRPAKAVKPRVDVIDKHPKKKRSYSVDMGVCDDLEVLAWYTGRSSSSVVEELVRRYLSQNRAALEKARDIRSQRP